MDEPPDIATANPVDVLVWCAKQAGRELDPDWVRQMHEHCGQIVPIGPDGLSEDGQSATITVNRQP